MMEGALEAFGVVEILQILGRMKHSGTMHIECPQRLIDIRFIRGSIAETRDSARSAAGSALGRLLVAPGLVSEEALARTLARQDVEALLLGTLLVEHGLVLEKDMREVLSRQIVNTLLAARFEARGGFLFITDEQPPEADGIVIDTHAVLLEISSLGAGSGIAGELLARGDALLVRSEGRSVSEDGVASAGDEAQLLDRVDGYCTVGELVCGSGLEPITAVNIVGRLVERGAVVLKPGPEEDGEAPAVRQARDAVDEGVALPPGSAGDERDVARDTL